MVRENVLQAGLEPETAPILKKIANDPETTKQLAALDASPSTSNNLRLDLIELKFHLGKINEAEKNRQTLAIMRSLLAKLNQSSADLLCSVIRLSGLHLSVTLSDLTSDAFKSRAALTALHCVDTIDERLTQTAIGMSRESFVRQTLEGQTSLFLALIHLPGLAKEKIDLANEFAKFIGLKFLPAGLLGAAEAGADQIRAINEVKRNDPYQSAMLLDVYASFARDENFATGLVESVRSDDPVRTAYLTLHAIIRTTPLRSSLWEKIVPMIAAQKLDVKLGLFSEIATYETVPAAIADFALDQYLRMSETDSIYAASTLANSTFTASIETALLKTIKDDPYSVRSQLSRWLLSKSPKYKRMSRSQRQCRARVTK